MALVGAAETEELERERGVILQEIGQANDTPDDIIFDHFQNTAFPGQALSYKLGQLKFLELRARAQRELGSKFDIRRFHDQMLSGGVLPLDLLDARTDAWIGAEKLLPPPAAAN